MEQKDTAERAVAPAGAAPQPDAGANVITIDQFRQVDLRVAEVLECEKVAGADKLLRLSLAIGEERRQIVAGVALHYAPEALVGKKIVVVYNLKPAVIRGLESRGMLLAAKDDQGLAVLTVDKEVKSGSKVS